jgi:hypothetical protein
MAPLVRFRPSVFRGFPGTCLNIRIPCCDLSHRQESMGLPKFLTNLFLHATACGLRRISSSSPFRMIFVLPSGPLIPSAAATTPISKLYRNPSTTFALGLRLGSRNNPYFEAVPALQETRFSLRPTGFSVYASPVLFIEKPPDSATGARLDTGEWLTLSRQGLSP